MDGGKTTGISGGSGVGKTGFSAALQAAQKAFSKNGPGSSFESHVAQVTPKDTLLETLKENVPSINMFMNVKLLFSDNKKLVTELTMKDITQHENAVAAFKEWIENPQEEKRSWNLANLRDEKTGETLLMRATALGDKDIVNVLLDHHAYTNYQDKQGMSALDYAEIARTTCIFRGSDHFITGITNSAPLLMPSGQREVTVF